jgi:hypothetical protein
MYKQKVGCNKTARDQPQKQMLNPVTVANACQADITAVILQNSQQTTLRGVVSMIARANLDSHGLKA